MFQVGSQRLFRGFASWSAIFCENFMKKSEKSIKIIQKKLFLEKFGFSDLMQSEKTLTYSIRKNLESWLVFISDGLLYVSMVKKDWNKDRF